MTHSVTNATAKIAERFVSKYFNVLIIIQMLTSLDVFNVDLPLMLC